MEDSSAPKSGDRDVSGEANEQDAFSTPTDAAIETTSITEKSDESGESGPVSSIPDDLSSLTGRSDIWNAADYASCGMPDLGDSHHAAGKLADSGVAPLVAAARGYGWADADTFKTAGTTVGVTSFTDRAGRKFRTLAERDGALILPWFHISSARSASRSGRRPLPMVIQMRPVSPRYLERPGKEPKPAKYEFLGGIPTIIDLHPSTPGEWLEDMQTPTVLFTEGVLKGDAAITSALMDAGASKADLSYDGNGPEASARLRGLLASIPLEKRVLVLTFGGVGTWHSHPEWNDMRLKGRAAWVAFDGDLYGNPMVWSEANKLWKKLDTIGAKPRLVDLHVVYGDSGEKEKVGLDDYLTKIGAWSSLPSRLRDDLPPRPVAQSEHREKDWRFNVEEMVAEECYKIEDPSGGSRLGWRRVSGLIGRVRDVQVNRSASSEELATGELDNEPAGGFEAHASVEVFWRGDDGETRST
ncbi:MAG: hypothetical protein M3Y35_17075, partial [Actinomycetota bacterium]|nr:hypothetical protein [Actinomycetota bacterium]